MLYDDIAQGLREAIAYERGELDAPSVRLSECAPVIICERSLPMPYCIYLRKSRADVEAESRGEGETLARHQRTLIDLAARMGLDISHIYREIVSGDSIAARPQMQQLLSDLRHGKWTGVLCMEVERLARGDTIDQGTVARTFKYSGAKIIYACWVYDPSDEADEEFFEFNLFMSAANTRPSNAAFRPAAAPACARALLRLHRAIRLYACACPAARAGRSRPAPPARTPCE